MTENISFISDFKEINRGYVAFRGNHKGGKISGKGKIKTGKLDFDDVYFVKELKFNLFIVSQMYNKKNSVLFIETECIVLSSDYKLPDENQVLLRAPKENIMRLGHINFKTMNKLVKGNLVRGLPSKIFKNNHTCVACQKGKQHRAYWNQPNDNAGIKENLDAGKVRKVTVSAQQYVLLPLWSTSSQDPQNTDDDAAFDIKENENDVHVSPSRSDKTDNKKQDDKAKRDYKGKSPVDSPTGVRDLRAEFEEFSSKSTNRVNVVSAPVNAARPNPTNNTNIFNTASPYVNAVSPKFGITGKSLFVNPFKYHDDPDMPKLEDIVYSDDEKDVGAETDLSNLETNIPVSPIPTTRVHKDHLVNQIIDVKSASTPEKPLLKDPDGVNTPRYDEDSIKLKELMVFMATTTIKKVNDVVHLRALINGKKVVVLEDVLRRDLYLDDADRVECLTNEEIFAELAQMGYEKPPPKLTFYKAFFCSIASAVICLATGRKFNFSKYIFDNMIRNVDSPRFFYVFANMRRLGKGFSRVETPLFASMLVQLQPQPQADQKEEEDEMPTASAPPSPTNALSSPPQDPTPTPHATPLQDQPFTPPASPPQEQPTTTSKSFMSLLTTLMETYASLSQKVAELEQDKHTQALEILKLKKRTQEEVAAMDAEPQKRINQEEVNAASKGVNAAEPTMHLDNIKKYQSLKKKPVSIAQARKNMIIYLKNMAGYKMEHFRGMTYDKVRPILKREYKKVQTLFKPDKDVEEPKKKRVTDETLLQEVSRKAYQSFEDILKGFDREDLVALWNLVKEKFSSAVPSVDKEKALWVELKILFEPDADDVLWHDIFMLSEKDYPLSNGVMILMLSEKLQVEEDNEMARDLVMKIFMEATKPKRRSLDTSSE
nr:hypothetical protein [Tanacetum cinerariifolium]